jgi:hypothetical protein
MGIPIRHGTPRKRAYGLSGAMFVRKRRCSEVGSPIAAPSGPGTPPVVVDSAEGGSGVKQAPMMVYGYCAAGCCTISEDDSLPIVFFAGILAVQLIELALE